MQAFDRLASLFVFVEIETQVKELEALVLRDHYLMTLDREPSLQDLFLGELEEWEKENPGLLEKYADTPYLEDSVARWEYLQQLDIVYEQLVHITGYDDYIAGIDARAEQMSSVSIFNQTGSFSLNNIQQTPKDFLPLKGLELKLGREAGIMSATNFRLTDLFIPVILFLFCIFLFLHEHDTGLDKLVKTARNGRYPTIAARITALSTLAVVLSALFYGSILIIGSYLYGFGDLSRYVQSMPSFQDCTIPMTVGQYLGLYLATKAGAALITGALMSLIFIVFGEGKSVFMVLAVFAAVSFVCYEFIHAASWLNLLKYVSRYNTLNNYLENREVGFQMFYDQYSEVLSLRKSVEPGIVDELSSDYYYKNATRGCLNGLLLVLLIVLAPGRVFPMEVENGTAKENIMQISRSKKWESKPALDEGGNPLMSKTGKKILTLSYSILQDQFFNFMRAVGYADVERGQRGSTEEHLTVTQYRVQAEQERLANLKAAQAMTEAEIEDLFLKSSPGTPGNLQDSENRPIFTAQELRKMRNFQLNFDVL